MAQLEPDSTEQEVTSQEPAGTPVSVSYLPSYILKTDPASGPQRLIAGCSIIFINLVWALIVAYCPRSAVLLPWSICFLLITGIVIARLYGQALPNTLSIIRLGNLKPASLADTIAMTMFTGSLILIGWMDLHGFKFPSNRPERQVIEIELVTASNSAGSLHLPEIQEQKAADANNLSDKQRHLSTGDPFSTRPKPKERADDKSKRIAALPTQPRTALSHSHGAFQTTRVASKASSLVPAPNRSVQSHPGSDLPIDLANAPIIISQPPPVQSEPQPTPTSRVQPVSRKGGQSTLKKQAFPIPTTWHETMIAAGFTPTAGGSQWLTKNVDSGQGTIVHVRSHSKESTSVLEEVAPPKLLEVSGNIADVRSQQAQKDSRREGGSKSALLLYLSDLHQRIKSSWRPPAGDTRTAKVLFRIKPDGTLMSIKLIRTSGDSDTDEAALMAITNCFPFKSLPNSFAQRTLDVLYTFNYNLDQLSEMPGSSTY